MKRFLKTASVIAAFAVLSQMTALVPQNSYADNPIVQTVYTSDPAPMVYDDVFYMYTGHDADGSTYFTMPDWKCYSSTDMQNWTDHGTILSCDDFAWSEPDSAWAAQCVERNGKFYMYVTLVPAATGGRAIGVAVADSPTGPFKDALGKPLCGPNWDYIDPTVFVDDDGQAYLYFGNPTLNYVKLNEDMISYSGGVQQIQLTTSGFGTRNGGDERHTTLYEEGPWFYKRGDLYYLLYAASGIPENICYSTSPNPTGPWTFRGEIMPSGGGSFTNHCGVVEYKGKAYFAYHNGKLPGGGGFTRSTAIEEFTYNPDGTITKLSMTNDGPKQIKALNPFVRTEAETICWESGIETEKCSAGGINIANIENGDYVKVSGVDFENGANQFTVSASSATEGGTIKIHIDSQKGTVIGECAVSGTGGWQTWKEFSCEISDVSGEHDLYFEFTGGSGFLLNADWWQFSSLSAGPDENGWYFHSTYEDDIDSWQGRGAAAIEMSGNESYKGSKSLYVQERTASWNGAYRKISSSAFEPGKEYSFSANVMYDTGSATDTFYMKLEYTDANGETQYSTIAEGTALKGEWVQLANTNYEIPADATGLHIYVETAESTNSFYLDEVIGAVAGTKIDGAGESKKVILGDVNFDERIDALDMAAARQGLIKGYSSSAEKLSADVDQSGENDVTDLVLIQSFIMRKITSFPVAEKPTEPPTEPEVSFDYAANLQYKALPQSYKSNCAQSGKVEKVNYQNKYANVYLPYGYNANDTSKKYNVFYLMHGGGENQDTIFSDDVNLKRILDNMIMNGDIEPMIVVTPTFNGSGDMTQNAQNFHNELVKELIPAVEGKYNTYAKSTSDADLKASRNHRAFGGFSMGGLTTWYTFLNKLDYFMYFMPLSGDCWAGNTADEKAAVVADAAKKSGYSKDEYFVMCATGTDDIAYDALAAQVESMKKHTDQFTYTSDFSKGNFYFLTCPGATHWWGYVVNYIYDALPYFFHE